MSRSNARLLAALEAWLLAGVGTEGGDPPLWPIAVPEPSHLAIHSSHQRMVAEPERFRIETSSGFDAPAGTTKPTPNLAGAAGDRQGAQ